MNLKYKSLTFKINTTILESHMQKTLDTITGENKSAAIKAEQYYTHFPPFEMQLISHVS